MLGGLKSRSTAAYYRAAARLLCRRPVKMQNAKPLISFTFDDFPRSALLTGGSILEQFGVSGTFYASAGLMGTAAPTGEIFRREDLSALAAGKHELGCHTYDHCHASHTGPEQFEASIVRNAEALGRLLPGCEVKTLSYPIGNPRPENKRRAARHFRASRAGGQAYNMGHCDLNYLQAFFLEQSRDDLRAITRIIDENALHCGWLIFATHDVCELPTSFGCTPDFFREVVRYCASSGVALLPVSQALELVNATAE